MNSEKDGFRIQKCPSMGDMKPLRLRRPSIVSTRTAGLGDLGVPLTRHLSIEPPANLAYALGQHMPMYFGFFGTPKEMFDQLAEHANLRHFRVPTLLQELEERVEVGPPKMVGGTQAGEHADAAVVTAEMRIKCLELVRLELLL
uniref:Uncharacterized protein n=1 Tax=Globodera rostochiensis TaxID=31243 RepID=A0A914HSN0_GLORO